MEAVDVLDCIVHLQDRDHGREQVKQTLQALCGLELPKFWEQYQAELLPSRSAAIMQPVNEIVVVVIRKIS